MSKNTSKNISKPEDEQQLNRGVSIIEGCLWIFVGACIPVILLLAVCGFGFKLLDLVLDITGLSKKQDAKYQS